MLGSSKPEALTVNTDVTGSSKSLEVADTINDKHNNEIKKELTLLLSSLVTTVEALLASHPKHVWQVYGGLSRVYNAVYSIFCHGCKHQNDKGGVDIWPVIAEIPELRSSVVLLSSRQDSRDEEDPGQLWLRQSLQKLELAANLECLSRHKSYIKHHYQSWSFLCSVAHLDALLICLTAIENNSQSMLAQINPKLLVGNYQSEFSTKEDSILQAQFSIPFLSNTKTDSLGVLSKLVQGTNNSQHIRKASKPLNIKNKDLDLYSKHQPKAHRFKSDSKSLNEELPSLMRRESPDGSSDVPSLDWSNSGKKCENLDKIIVANQDVPNTSKGNFVGGCATDRINIANTTGTRPKNFTMESSTKRMQLKALSSDNEDYGQFAASERCISPHVLEVDYGGGHTTSDGDGCLPIIASNQIKGRSISMIQESPSSSQIKSKTPQLWRRHSSNRITQYDTDPDTESERESSPPNHRRRRRPTHESQEKQSHGQKFSVKGLIDSRGILEHGLETMMQQNASNEDVRVSDDNFSGAAQTESPSVENEKNQPHKESMASRSSSPYSLSNSPSITPLPIIMVPPREKRLSTTSLPKDLTDGRADNFDDSKDRNDPSMHQMISTMKKTHSRSRSDGSQSVIKYKQNLISSNVHTNLVSQMKTLKSDGSELSGSVTSEMSLGQSRQKRFMEDGGLSITPAADGYFPTPQPGQSLVGFLSSKGFRKTCAEMDRENAHFSISEAIIAAVQQMGFEAWRQSNSQIHIQDDSDEEIRTLQERIRQKQRQKKLSDRRKPRVSNSLQGSPGKLDSTTDYSVCESPQSSNCNSESDILSDLEEHDSNESLSNSCTQSPSKNHNDSDASKYPIEQTSAENVALNLLKMFNEQTLPKASDMEWLVSETDAPQKLLPLPNSVAVSPDDAPTNSQSSVPPLQMSLRGTAEWAPPRPQLILTLHKNTKRSTLLVSQGWRCAGCGMKVSERLSHHFRLCNYIGRYFCTTCHTNQTAIIPAKVLHKWDFNWYAVASFSFELLQCMAGDPLFDVGSLNPNLYKRSKQLNQTHVYRLQLYHTVSYIQSCSRAKREQELLEKFPNHWSSEPHVYSLCDLISVKEGTFMHRIKELTERSISHVAKCQVCRGLGFICEICNLGDPIFPFQLESTALCGECRACYHAACFSPTHCPRCIRREIRREQAQQMSSAKTPTLP